MLTIADVMYIGKLHMYWIIIIQDFFQSREVRLQLADEP